MSLKDHVQTRKKPGLPCSVGVAIQQLNDEDRMTLAELMGTKEQRGVSASVIYQALTSYGFTVGYQSINRHRAAVCGCFL